MRATWAVKSARSAISLPLRSRARNASAPEHVGGLDGGRNHLRVALRLELGAERSLRSGAAGARRRRGGPASPEVASTVPRKGDCRRRALKAQGRMLPCALRVPPPPADPLPPPSRNRARPGRRPAARTAGSGPDSGRGSGLAPDGVRPRFPHAARAGRGDGQGRRLASAGSGWGSAGWRSARSRPGRFSSPATTPAAPVPARAAAGDRQPGWGSTTRGAQVVSERLRALPAMPGPVGAQPGPEQ